MSNRNTVKIENARIIFRNFSGKESQYNRAGDRNFGVIVENPELVEALISGGWNVKVLKPREEGDEPIHYISIKVNYTNFPPNVYRISGKTKILLNEDTVCMLDNDDIITADLIISPYHWTLGNKSGVRGYLKTAYITVEEDEFAAKYGAFDSSPIDDDDNPF